MRQQVGAAECVPHAAIGILLERVHILPPRSFEDGGVLRHQAHDGAQQFQPQPGDVQGPDEDAPRPGLEDAKQAKQRRRLTATRRAGDAALHPRRDNETHGLQDGLLCTVARGELLELDAKPPREGPVPALNPTSALRPAKFLGHGSEVLRFAVHSHDVEASMRACEGRASWRDLVEAPPVVQHQCAAGRVGDEQRRSAAREEHPDGAGLVDLADLQ
mmetsp:Transcript_18363/g.52570  ORF Transcript_18363/g.52570 Transcript_18363/m.52570 type:complete len:217 (+) Transcript_18363:413-1063(+)